MFFANGGEPVYHLCHAFMTMYVISTLNLEFESFIKG